MENRISQKKEELKKERAILNGQINQYKQALQSCTNRIIEINGALKIIEELEKKEVTN